MPRLRDYQSDDFAKMVAALRDHRRVLGVWATGLGKSALIAALAKHYSASGRVLVLVDVKKLVQQDVAAIKHFAGINPGIEMADSVADNGGNGFVAPDPVVVASTQSMYSGGEGTERFRKYCPADFSLVLADETELYAADNKSRTVVDYFLDGNPDLRLVGVTATPFRTDRVAMANLFDKVAFNKNITWGISNGYLVDAKQAFVRVNVDFSTLKLVKNSAGESDYSDSEIASKINNERTLIELAKGILGVAGERKTIVACPDVETARAVAHYLDGEKMGCASSIYGKLGDTEKDEIFNAFSAGRFQFLTSCSMLLKGFDEPTIGCVVNCRKTKSKRLYQQLVGRGVRPLRGVVDHPELDTPEKRRSAIAASNKPDVIMCNLVGVDDWVRDITVHDVLGKPARPEVMERAKQLSLEEGLDADAAIEQAEEELEADQELERLLGEEEAEEMVADDVAREMRRRVQVEAQVDVEYQDGLGVERRGTAVGAELIPPRQLDVLRKFKVPEAVIAKLTPQEASKLTSKLVYRRKLGLATYSQCDRLRKYGYTKDQLRRMSFDEASTTITRIRDNGWRRPQQEEAMFS